MQPRLSAGILPTGRSGFQFGVLRVATLFIPGEAIRFPSERMKEKFLEWEWKRTL